jgi:hypothetical protein
MLEQYPTVEVVHFWTLILRASWVSAGPAPSCGRRHCECHARLAARVVKFLSHSLPVNYHQLPDQLCNLSSQLSNPNLSHLVFVFLSSLTVHWSISTPASQLINVSKASFIFLSHLPICVHSPQRHFTCHPNIIVEWRCPPCCCTPHWVRVWAATMSLLLLPSVHDR